MPEQLTQHQIAHRNVSAALSAYVNKQDPEIREILVAYYNSCMKTLEQAPLPVEANDLTSGQ